MGKEGSGGFMEPLVSSWGNLIRAVLLIAAFFLGTWLIIGDAVKRFSPSGNLRLTTAGGTTIVFGDAGQLHSLLVRPRGWQSTDIEVKEGQQLTLSASGSVHIAMGRMVLALDTLYAIKQENFDSTGVWDLSTFTEEQMRASLMAYPWIEPTGLDLKLVSDNVLKLLGERSDSAVVPGAKAGQLVAVIADPEMGPGGDPDLSKSQVVPFSGKIHKATVKRDGELWFIVNDLTSQDELKKRLLWDDNLGFFEVKIRIE